MRTGEYQLLTKTSRRSQERRLCPSPCDPRGGRNHRQPEEASQACRPPRRPAGKLSPQLRASASFGKPVAPAQSRPTRIRAVPTPTPGRTLIYNDCGLVGRSLGRPLSRSGVRHRLNSEERARDRRRASRNPGGRADQCNLQLRASAAERFLTARAPALLHGPKRAARGKEGQLNCIPEQCLSHRTFPLGHRGRYSKPHAAAVVPTDAQRPLRWPRQPSRQAPSKLVPSACVWIPRPCGRPSRHAPV